MWKHAAPCCRQVPTGDPDCSEGVELGKQIKCLIGNKAAFGDGEEKLDLEAVESGKSGANSSTAAVHTSPSAEVAGVSVAEAAVLALASSTLFHCDERGFGTTTGETEAKKNEFIEMHQLNSLSMQKNAEAGRQQRREEQQANWELMQMIVGLQEEQVEALQEEEQEQEEFTPACQMNTHRSA